MSAYSPANLPEEALLEGTEGKRGTQCGTNLRSQGHLSYSGYSRGTPGSSAPCGKQHWREIATPDLDPTWDSRGIGALSDFNCKVAERSHCILVVEQSLHHIVCLLHFVRPLSRCLLRCMLPAGRCNATRAARRKLSVEYLEEVHEDRLLVVQKVRLDSVVRLRKRLRQQRSNPPAPDLPPQRDAASNDGGPHAHDRPIWCVASSRS